MITFSTPSNQKSPAGKVVSMHSFKKIMVASVIAASVNACQILPSGDGAGYRDARPGEYSPYPKSVYMERFQELQKEIDQLKGELADSKASYRNQQELLVARHQRKEKVDEIKRLVEQKVADVKGEIDELVASLSDNGLDGHLVAINANKDVDEFNSALPPGAGHTNKENSVQIVQTAELEDYHTESTLQKIETTISSPSDAMSSAQSQRYDVVYVFENEPPQESMWTALDSFEISDKWRGINREKQSYFIYVGVYNSLDYAQDRKLSLADLTGQSPQIKSQSVPERVSLNRQ